jgi:hypothetical protein
LFSFISNYLSLYIKIKLKTLNSLKLITENKKKTGQKRRLLQAVYD